MKTHLKIVWSIVLLNIITFGGLFYFYFIKGLPVYDFYTQYPIIISENSKVDFMIQKHHGIFQSGSPYQITILFKSKVKGETLQIDEVYLTSLDDNKKVILQDNEGVLTSDSPVSSLRNNDEFVGGISFDPINLEHKSYRLTINTSKGDLLNFSLKPFIHREKASFR